MRRSTLALCALLAVSTLGCEQINKIKAQVQAALDRRRGRTPATATRTATLTRDTTKHPAPAAGAAPVTGTPTAGAKTPQPAAGALAPPPRLPPVGGGGQAEPFPGVPRGVRDVPYDSPDTGTVAPGMSERQVYSLWGRPAAVRREGEYTYLFFPNSCERTCGTLDLVMLQNDRVVDAIVRWPGHNYSGESSSPPGKKHGPHRPGDSLRVHSS
jgi:hypothetical protein